MVGQNSQDHHTLRGLQTNVDIWVFNLLVYTRPDAMIVILCLRSTIEEIGRYYGHWKLRKDDARSYSTCHSSPTV